MNNTVTKEVLDSLGGLKDTIKPISGSLTTHEMRPYEIHIDYRQTLQNLKREDQESMRASLSCLKGEPGDSQPRPLYQREGDHESINGINMIGKARLVSASPFRATYKLDRENVLDEDSDDDDQFNREDFPELQRIHESPIKDDSELLRHQKTELLHAFSQSQSHLRRSSGGAKDIETVTNHSERMPRVPGGDLKGIMIHETRTSFDKTRN